MGDLEACGCFEKAGVQTGERLVYKGEGMGSYAQVSNMEMVGAGKGDFEKETYVTSSGSKLRAGCVAMGCVGVMLVIALVALLWPRPDMADDVVVPRPEPQPEKTIIHDQYYTHVKDVHVPHMVPVPIPGPPRQVINHKVYVHTSAFDCDAGMSDWKHMWSGQHQRYCCYKHHIACTTKVDVRPHYHTITHYKTVSVPEPVPVPAPPAQVINKVVNVPIHDAPQVIRVPVPGHPNVVPKYVHQKHYVPVPEPTAPVYHSVPVPTPVHDPGHVIHVPSPLPPQTVVRNKVIYKTRHVKVQHVYNCQAGFSNWKYGWSSAKQSWCCAHESRGCPGTWTGHGLTKTVVTHVTTGHESSYSSPEVVHVHHYHHHYGASDEYHGDGYQGGEFHSGGYHSGGYHGGSYHEYHSSGYGSGSFSHGSHSFGGSGSFSHSYGGSGSFSHSFGGSGSFSGSHSSGGFSGSGSGGFSSGSGVGACDAGHAHNCPSEWSQPGNSGGFHCLHKLARQTSQAAYEASGGACRPASDGPFPHDDCQVQCRVSGLH